MRLFIWFKNSGKIIIFSMFLIILTCILTLSQFSWIVSTELDNNYFLSPPVIDIGSLTSVITRDETRQNIVQQLGRAVREWGFFTVINHGISQNLIEALLKETRLFFHSGPDVLDPIRRTIDNSRGYTDLEYTKQKIDAKHIFDVGHKPFPHLPDSDPKNVVLDGYNQWPSSVEFVTFRSVVTEYYDQCAHLSDLLLEAIMESLETEEDGDSNRQYSISSAFLQHTSFIRLNYYPLVNNTIAAATALAASSTVPTPSAMSVDMEGLPIITPVGSLDSVDVSANSMHDPIRDILGVSRHTDAGALTVLLQDQVRGLEVYTGSKQDFADGRWVSVPPVAGGLTINVGDMLQVWSNDVFKAAEHRVRASVGNNTRISVPFFYNPSYTALVAPKPSSTQPVARYRPIVWGDFRKERFLGDFSDRGREIQIEDFRILKST